MRADREALTGVQFNPPPVGPIMEAANRLALDAAANLPAGAQGGIFAIATTAGFNAVVVHKVNDHFFVAGHIGKTWGEPLAFSASAVMTW